MENSCSTSVKKDFKNCEEKIKELKEEVNRLSNLVEKLKMKKDYYHEEHAKELIKNIRFFNEIKARIELDMKTLRDSGRKTIGHFRSLMLINEYQSEIQNERMKENGIGKEK